MSNGNFDNYSNQSNPSQTSLFQDRNLKNNIGFLCIVLSIFCLLRCYEVLVDINNKKNSGIQNYITGRGTFEIELAPHIGNLSFVVKNFEKNSKDAHQKLILKSNNLMTALYEKGIAKEDVKAENYVSRPKFANDSCVKGNCPPSKQGPVGFETSQIIFVKIRDLKKTTEIVSFLADENIEEINPISYETENLENIKEQARFEAINLAKRDAQNIAKSLGVRLNKVIKFNENYPIDDRLKRPNMPNMPNMIESRDDFSPNYSFIQGENGQQKLRSTVVINYHIN